uniref:ATP synthase complex subunit 8 n=1 Tax=Timema californicum TaxID=61474 RepID=Q2Q1H9_TIMCA|nr:ATP synthase F0 subunit 8 [Timema californicum]
MPQMAPISWILMFTFFIMNLMMFTTLNYCSFNVNFISNVNKTNMMKSMYNWKW